VLIRRCIVTDKTFLELKEQLVQEICYIHNIKVEPIFSNINFVCVCVCVCG
jgi:hypothetical protein